MELGTNLTGALGPVTQTVGTEENQRQHQDLTEAFQFLLYQREEGFRRDQGAGETQ